MKAKLTFADELAFWKLCGWRVEQYTKGSDNTRDKETKTIVHHPKCTCVITDKNCTCLISCSKITDVNVIFQAAQTYFHANRPSLVGPSWKAQKIDFSSPSISYAIIEAVLNHSRKGKQNVTKSERN